MLILTRGPNERIVAGDVIVTVVGFRSGSRVRLGIEAPPDVRVDRQEVHEEIIRQRGPFPETRRVPVELLQRIADVLDLSGAGPAAVRRELNQILEPRKDGR